MNAKQGEYNFDVYISYNRGKDKFMAEKIARYLSEHNVRPFFDAWELNVGDSFSSTIENALNTSRYIVLIVSPSSLRSPWVPYEWAQALTIEPRQSKHRLLPLWVDNVIPPASLQSIQGIPVNSHDPSSIQKAAQKIVDTFKSEKRHEGEPEELSSIEHASQSLPTLDIRGLLPPGVYNVSLDEVVERFGTGNKQRAFLAKELESLYQRAKIMGATALLLGGSFVSNVPYPNDLDVVLVFPSDIKDEDIVADADVVQTYVQQNKHTFVASGEESVQHWIEFLANSFLGEPRGVLRMEVT
jgi:hypothetical protein